MSFNIALSGLNAAQKDLDVTSNNIANVSTVGFKESRAEFVDVYAASLLAAGNTKVGDGVLTSDVAQQFQQGSIQFTQNSLDLAITGNGFFAVVPEIGSQEFSYTRAGQFKPNSDNFIVNSAGQHLLGFPVAADGSSTSVSLSTAQPIQIPTTSGAPKATTVTDIRMNLPSGDPIKTGSPANFDIGDKSTYNYTTSLNVYDSLGNSHIMSYYFIKEAPVVANPSAVPPVAASNPWLVTAAIDGQRIDLTDPTGASTGVSINGIDGARLNFSPNGDFSSQEPASGFQTAALGASILTNGSDPTQTIIVDFNLDTAGPNTREPTSYSGKFEATRLEDDGLPVGRLTGLDIGPDGLVLATYSNGTSQPLSRVALVNFANNQGLTQDGNTNWKESILSGQGLAGEAGSGTYGGIQSSALEQSNVNLTTELIDLISAQRNFQANSRSLEVDNQLNQTILQIR